MKTKTITKTGEQMTKQTQYTLDTFRDLLKSDKSYNAQHGGFNYDKARSKAKCPIFKTFIPYKSFTIVVDNNLQDSAEYWCNYIHGSNCIQKTKILSDNKVAIRSDYMCW